MIHGVKDGKVVGFMCCLLRLIMLVQIQIKGRCVFGNHLLRINLVHFQQRAGIALFQPSWTISDYSDIDSIDCPKQRTLKVGAPLRILQHRVLPFL